MKMLKAVGLTFVASTCWCVCVGLMNGYTYEWQNYTWDGSCWAMIMYPVFCLFLREAKCTWLLCNATLCSVVFFVPFGYAALFAAFPDMIILIILVSMSMFSLGSVYPVVLIAESEMLPGDKS